MSDFFEERNEVANVRDFLLVKKNVRVLENALHRAHIVDEVRREITFVELHTGDDFISRFGGFAFFDGDDAVVPDRFHRVGEEFADFAVVVRADGADVRDFFFRRNRFRHFRQFGDGRGGGFVDPAADRGRVASGGDVAEAFFEDGASQDGRGGGAVADDVVRLRRDFVDELGAHIFERVVEFDFFTDGDAVFGNFRAAVSLVQNDVATGRAEGNGDRVGQFINAVEHLATRRVVENELFSHLRIPLYKRYIR